MLLSISELHADNCLNDEEHNKNNAGVSIFINAFRQVTLNTGAVK